MPHASLWSHGLTTRSNMAVSLAEVEVVGSPGVLISGSVIAISEARVSARQGGAGGCPGTRENLDDEWDADYPEDGHETDRDWR